MADNTIKSRIVELCDKQGITVQALENRLGIGNGTIGKWDSSYPNTKKILQVAKALNTSTDYLLTGEYFPVPLDDDALKEKEAFERAFNWLVDDYIKKESSPYNVELSESEFKFINVLRSMPEQYQEASLHSLQTVLERLGKSEQ